MLSRLRLKNEENISGQHAEDLALLSALIDQGRFFFPYVEKGKGYREDKPSAYQNYRNLALDFLVESYKLFKSSSSSNSAKKARILQKYFTSIVFEIVRPKDRLDNIRSLTKKYFIKDVSFEDFLKNGDTSIFDNILRSRIN